MFGLSNLHLERLSFWLGFLAASLFWWVFSIIRGQLPQFRTTLKTRSETTRKRSSSTIDDRLRKITIQKAQSMHLAEFLFPLSEILIPPRLLAQPLPVAPDGSLPVEDNNQLVIPTIPDWPELAASYAVPLITLAEALQSNINIAVIGRPGSGKTVTLAHLAFQLAQHDAATGSLSDHFPILIHVGEIQHPDNNSYDALNIIISIVNKTAPAFIKHQLPRFIRSLFSEGKVLLLLDGADELGQAEFGKFSQFLERLLKEYPQVRIAIACSDDYIDGILPLGFVPLGMANWSSADNAQFIEQWNEQWQTSVEPILNHQNSHQPIDLFILKRWLLGDSILFTPFELTLKVMLSYLGESFNPKNTDVFDAYLRRILSGEKIRQPAEKLALQTILEGQAILSANTVSGIFSEVSRVIPDLINSGLLVTLSNESNHFCHPIFTGFLASHAIHDDEQLKSLQSQPTWSGKTLLLHYLVVHFDMNAIIEDLLTKDADDPLNRQLLAIARWLPDAPADETWRTQILRRLLDMLKRENLPFSLRARAAAALISSNDPSIPILFRQLLLSSSPVVRQLGCLGCGAIHDNKSITDLGGLLSDPVPWVRYSACMALVAIGTTSSIKVATEALMYGDENLGRITTEALSTQPILGYSILRDSSASNNLLIRRASVYGLIRIHESWALEILEKMRVEDGQWVVRNAASHALETTTLSNPFNPRPLLPPHETPWLVTFASKQGMGISPKQPIKELVFNVLSTGSSEEKQAVFNYLRLVKDPDPGLIGAIYKIMYQEDGPVRESACYALWLMAISGTNLPSPLEFGMN